MSARTLCQSCRTKGRWRSIHEKTRSELVQTRAVRGWIAARCRWALRAVYQWRPDSLTKSGWVSRPSSRSTVPRVAPAMMAEQSVRVRCHEASLEQLLSELAVHRLDIVLSDQPVPDGLNLKAYNHRLGESSMSFFAQRNQARRYKSQFPDSLADAPMLLPSPNSALRRRLDDWFEAQSTFPRIVGEFDDSALLKAFGEAGAGVFAGPTVIAEEICRMYRMSVIGETDDIKERYYAISPERLLRHSSVVLITDTARADLFTP